ncbi:MAG: TlpA family protein disulfide reductase [Solirubrobacterales bacterium]|jgi:thiol-disulfide isomerase/thioredoxin
MRHPREKPDFGVGKTSVVALLGVLVAAAAGIVIINLLAGQESKTVGLGEYRIGEQVDPFAVPNVRSDLEGDANIDRDEACEIEVEGAIRVCDYFSRPLVISFWFTRGAARCVDVQDAFDRVAAKYGNRVGMLSINVLDDRERVEEIVAEREWEVTVGHDRDGAVANLFRVGGCPTFLFVAPGGKLVRAEAGETDFRRLDAQVRSFLNGQEEEAKG